MSDYNLQAEPGAQVGTNPPAITLLLRAMVVLAVTTYFCAPLYHPETFWYLTLGHWIQEHGQVPVVDLWTAAGEGRPWVSASWLFSLLLSSSEWVLGERGLLLFTLLNFILLGGVASWVFASRSGDPFVGVSLTIILCGAVLLLGAPTPEIPGIALALLGYEALERFLSSGKVTWLSGCVASLIMLVNVHPLYYPLLLLVVLSLWARRPRNYVAIVLCLLTVVCTPYLGLQVPQLVAQWSNAISFIAASREGVPSVYHYPFAFLLLLLLLAAIFSRSTSMPLRPVELPFFALGVLAGFFALNFTGVAVALSALMLAKLWAAGAQHSGGNLAVAVSRLREKSARLPTLGVIWIALCVVIVNVVNLFKFPFDDRALPVRVVDRLLEDRLPGPVFHEPEIGSYLIFRFATGRGEPTRAAALDLRTPAILPELAAELAAFRGGLPGWLRLADRFAPQTIVCRARSPLDTVLRGDPSWRLVFDTVRQDSAPSAMEWSLFTRADGAAAL